MLTRTQWASGQGRRSITMTLLGACMVGAGVVGVGAASASAETILFIRGGAGTGGFLSGGSDSHLSDIGDQSTNGGNTAWGQFADLLESQGYTLEQLIEGPVDDNTPIDFTAIDLSAYAAIVLGSNNAEYTEASVDAVEAFVRAGGGLMAISDANWGVNWGDAPTSDQPFLDRFGLIMNQDRGTYGICRGDGDFFVVGIDQGDHPILAGIECFDGEGVSPVSLADTVPPGVRRRILSNAEGQVRRNTSEGQGPSSPATDDDASLVIALAGRGRVVGHFDRNTFFNENGAGTSLVRLDNTAYATQLMAWLSGRVTCDGDVNADGNVDTSDLLSILSAWGSAEGGPEDINTDGNVGISDLLPVLAGWGMCS
ncbi:MAG: hypothetical protein AB8G96_16055 [Phycisphaerales bacterium]